MIIIRFILGRILLFLEKVFSQRGLVRLPQDQSKVDAATNVMELYQFEACPFCIKVRMAIKRLGLRISYVDILKDKAKEEELIKLGGQRQVPCLKIRNPDGSIKWLYESSDIIKFLEQNFA